MEKIERSKSDEHFKMYTFWIIKSLRLRCTTLSGRMFIHTIILESVVCLYVCYIYLKAFITKMFDLPTALIRLHVRGMNKRHTTTTYTFYSLNMTTCIHCFGERMYFCSFKMCILHCLQLQNGWTRAHKKRVYFFYYHTGGWWRRRRRRHWWNDRFNINYANVVILYM